MSNFSIQNLFSVPKMVNERVLPEHEGKWVISLLQAMDMMAVDHLKLLDGKKEEEINNTKLYEIRTAWYDKPEVIDAFIQEYKEKIRPEDADIVQSWKNYVRGKFICAKYFAEYAAFYSLEHNVFFAVNGITEDFEDVVELKPPYVVATTLLPFKDKIIWDGLVMIGDITFTKANTMQLLDLCKLARREDKIIKNLSMPVPLTPEVMEEE